MAEAGAAFVSLVPSAKGFGRATEKQISGDMDTAGKKTGSRFGTFLKAGALTAVGGAAIGAAAFAKSAISLEATFSKTMNVLKATTGATGKEMKGLTDLALKMGAETVFSAADASTAMLELARGGIKPADIQAGALQGTLTLAAAGELEMGEAANFAVKAMGQFNLAGKDMDGIAAALAGGANASSASVRDMASALAQGGLAANSVGFSIQETTAVLAAFSNAGLEGSDAGTSMKTMLDRLNPSTKKAEVAMRDLGLFTSKGGSEFVKANGEFESAAVISEKLKQATDDLSASERKKAISTIFGSDAQRAATIFAEEGAAGMNKLLKATSDTSAAQKMAGANMKGTAGAIESLKGSVETLTLRFGMLIAPYVQAGLRWLTDLVNRASAALSGAKGSTGWVTQLAAWVRNDLVPAFRELAADVLPHIGPAMASAKQAFSDARPFLTLVGKIITSVLIPGIGKLAGVAIPMMAAQWRMVGKVLGTVGKIAMGMWDNYFQPVFRFLATAIGKTLEWFGKFLQLVGKAPGMGWVGELGDKLVDAGKKAAGLADNIDDIDTQKTVTIDIFQNVHNRRKTGTGFTPGPQLASGGILTRPTVFLGGEGGESEAVLPLSKLSAMLDRERSMASGGVASRGGNRRLTLVVGDREFDAYVDERVGTLGALGAERVRAR